MFATETLQTSLNPITCEMISNRRTCVFSVCVIKWAYDVVCHAKRCLLISDRQKAFLCQSVALNITGNWFHCAVSVWTLVTVIWVFNQVIVQIPNRPVMFALSILQTILWLLSKAYCVNLTFQRLNTQKKVCLKPGRMQDTMHPSFYMRDCDFYLYYTLLLYSLIMICIFTLVIFYQSWSLGVMDFRRETQMCILSQVSNITLC